MAINKNLIQGQKIMLDAARDTSVASFSAGFKQAMDASLKMEKEENEKLDRWMSKLGTPSNIRKIDPEHRVQIDEWVTTKQKAYVEAREKYDDDKTPENRRAYEKIEQQFLNLNEQLDEYALERKNYASAADGQKLKLGGLGSDWYVNNYVSDDADTTGAVEGSFSVNDDGKIMFADDVSFDSKKGKWNVQNDKAMGYIQQRLSTTSKLALEDGKTGNNRYIKSNSARDYKKQFDSTGPEGVMVLAQTDITPDDEDTNTFAQNWAGGKLDESFYAEFNSADGTDWMEKPENADKLSKMMSEYLANTEEELYNILRKDAFNKEDNKSFLDTPGKGLFVGGTNQTATRSSGQTLLKELKEGKGKMTNFLGRSITFDPINDVYTTVYEGETNTYQGVEDFLGALGITDPAFRNIVPKKSKNDNNDNNDNNNNNNNKNITLDMSLVTSTVDDNLFKRFEEVAPGFSFKPMLSETTQQPIKDRYIVTAPNGGTLKIHLNRSISKESTRKKLETFFNNNRIQ